MVPFPTTLNDPNPDFKLCHYSILNISKAVRDRDTVTEEYYYTRALFKDVVSTDLEWLGEICNDTKNRAACLRQLSFLSSFCCVHSHLLYKKLSCRREAARCFVFVCSQLQHTYTAHLLLPVPAASDLLVHKILLNSVLLSYCLRRCPTNPPDKHP